MICHLKAALYMWLLVTRRTVFSSEMTSYRTAWLRLIHALLINRPNFHGDEPSQLWSKTNHYSKNHQITNHNSPMYFFIPIMKIRLNRWESKLIWLTWFPNSFGPRLMQTTVLGRVDIARKDYLIKLLLSICFFIWKTSFRLRRSIFF